MFEQTVVYFLVFMLKSWCRECQCRLGSWLRGKVPCRTSVIKLIQIPRTHVLKSLVQKRLSVITVLL